MGRRLKRLDALATIYDDMAPCAVVTIMGAVAAELQSLGHRPNHFYLQHAMGLASSVGLGIALCRPDLKVVVLDGDGSLLMNLGSLATIALMRPANLVLIVWDNHQWAETGGQPTHTATCTDLAGISSAAGIPRVAAVSTIEAFEEALDQAAREDGPWCIVADVEERGRPMRPILDIEANLLRFRRTFEAAT